MLCAGTRVPALNQCARLFFLVAEIRVERVIPFPITGTASREKNFPRYDCLFPSWMRLRCIIACRRNSRLPKIITSRHRESETGRARQYIKSRLMLPTIPLAMVTLLTGYGSLAFMWFQDTLTLQALLASTALFVVGAIFGWAHVRYERYLVRTCPEYLARKHK